MTGSTSTRRGRSSPAAASTTKSPSTRPSTGSARPTASSASPTSTSQTTTPRTSVSRPRPSRSSASRCRSPSSATGKCPSGPCELDHFASLVGTANQGADRLRRVQVRDGWPDRRGQPCSTSSTRPDERYSDVKTRGTASRRNPQIFPAIDEARRIIRGKKPGHNVLRYLLLRMRNEVLKPQYYWEPYTRLSNLNLSYGCIPFDEMPFCTAPRAHNPRFWDLINSLDTTGRTHELLARRVQTQCRGPRHPLHPGRRTRGPRRRHRAHRHLQRHALLQAPARPQPCARQGPRLHPGVRGRHRRHRRPSSRSTQPRRQRVHRGRRAVARRRTAHVVDDAAKREALTTLFAQSRVALDLRRRRDRQVPTMVDHIANYFNDKSKLFLANTNPAVDNLRRR